MSEIFITQISNAKYIQKYHVSIAKKGLKKYQVWTDDIAHPQKSYAAFTTTLTSATSNNNSNSGYTNNSNCNNSDSNENNKSDYNSNSNNSSDYNIYLKISIYSRPISR